MKFNLSLALLVSAVIVNGAAVEKKDACTGNVVECKIKDLLLNDAEFGKKVQECAKGGDVAKIAECALTAAELTPEQVKAVTTVQASLNECSKEPTEKAKTCGTECKEDKKCLEKCEEDSKNAVSTCLATKAKTPKFDFKTAGECSKKCPQEKVTELINCDYKCNQELYKGLGAELKSATGNANRVQFGSLNLVAFALPLTYLFFN